VALGKPCARCWLKRGTKLCVPKVAFIHFLTSKRANVFVADRDKAGAESVAKELNALGKGKAYAGALDVADWEQQVSAFEAAISALKRVNYVFPIAGVGERPWLPIEPKSTSWHAPDLTTLDIDLKGVMYTVALAVQYFRRQDVADYGFRGKIMGVASVCGFYSVPTLPVYTAAKHGVVGFVRTYGKYLPEEKITLNAVCPNVVRTHISTEAFYDQIDARGLMVPMSYLLDTFSGWLGSDTTSGQLVECGPKGSRVFEPPQFMDKESEELCGDRGLLYQRSRKLHPSA